jgi:regulatory LuxR family protein
VSDSDPQSLILSEQEHPAQLSFFSEDEAWELIEGPLGGHQFTGERLFARYPQKYQLCVRMIAEGLATRQIARALQISANTVIAVREREKIPVEALKQSLLTDVRNAAKLCVERVIELAPEMTGRDAAIASGIMIEKMQLLSGEATSITEHKEDKIKHAEFNALIDSLPLANAHEVPLNGFSADSPEQKAPTEPGPGDQVEDGVADSISDTLQSKTPSSNALSSSFAPISGGNAAEREGGRGGSASIPPGGGSD